VPERRVIPFTERGGVYWGPPADDGAAIEELERQRSGGASFLAIAWVSFWWLETFGRFSQYVRSRFPCVLSTERMMVFDLRAPASGTMAGDNEARAGTAAARSGRGASAREPSARKFVFICGLHRSGTSVLHRVLRSHGRASGFQDTGAIEDEGQHLQTVFPPAAAFGGPGRFAFDPRSHLTECSPLVDDANRRELFAQWSRYWDLEKDVLLEKSPPNIIRSRFLQAMFPRCWFIFIVRHPIPTSLATRKWSHTGLGELLRHWVSAHGIMLDDLPFLRRYLLLRYEDLCAASAAELARAWAFLDLEPRPSSEALGDQNQRYFRMWEKEGGAHKEVLSQEDAPALLARFGYLGAPPYVRDCDLTGAPAPAATMSSGPIGG
jgi:Sulfotransferase family